MDHHDHGTTPKHQHGGMDIGEQERTFDGFLRGAAIVVVVTVAILIFLAFVGT